MSALNISSALIVFYLLYLSWTTVVFSLPSCNRLPGSTKVVKTVSVIQSYTLFAFALALIILAPKFGNHPECNRNAVLVLFRPFKVFNAGRILGFISIGLVVLMYTVMTILDYIPQDKKDRARKMLVQRMTAKFMHLGSAEEWPADRESPNPERPEQPEQFEAPIAYQSEVNNNILLSIPGLNKYSAASTHSPSQFFRRIILRITCNSCPMGYSRDEY